MRFLALHADGYGGEGTWSPSFEIEAADPESVPTSVRALPGAGRLSQQELDLYTEDYPDASAATLAVLTGGQHIGALASAVDGMVVWTKSGPVEEEDEYHWTELNVPEDSDDPLGDAEALREEWENDRMASLST